MESIIAVTRPLGIGRVTSNRACFWPYQSEKWSIFNDRLLVIDLLVNDRFAMLATGDCLQPIHAAGQASPRRNLRAGVSAVAVPGC